VLGGEFLYLLGRNHSLKTEHIPQQTPFNFSPANGAHPALSLGEGWPAFNCEAPTARDGVKEKIPKISIGYDERANEKPIIILKNIIRFLCFITYRYPNFSRIKLGKI
jgi:hypothetical protein